MTGDPLDPLDVGAIRHLLGELEVGLHQSHIEDAAGWVIVVTDDEFGKLVHVDGPYPTPEAALIAAGERHADDVRLNPEEAAAGAPLWTYTVLPMFPLSKPRLRASVALVPVDRDPGRAYCECGHPLEWSPYLLAYSAHLCTRTFRP